MVVKWGCLAEVGKEMQRVRVKLSSLHSEMPPGLQAVYLATWEVKWAVVPAEEELVLPPSLRAKPCPLTLTILPLVSQRQSMGRGYNLGMLCQP